MPRQWSKHYVFIDVKHSQNSLTFSTLSYEILYGGTTFYGLIDYEVLLFAESL